MSVRLAVQVFSRSTAKALETLRKLGIEGFEGSEATEKFIMIINDLFDSLNSRNVRGYGYSKPLYKDSAINTLRMMASAKLYICGLKHDVTNLLVVKGWLVCWLGWKLCRHCMQISLRRIFSNICQPTDYLRTIWRFFSPVSGLGLGSITIQQLENSQLLMLN